MLQMKFHGRSGVSTCAIAIALGMTSAAHAQTAPTSVTVNPNLAEWSLIKLEAADVQTAAGGAGATVAVIDGKADCRNAALVNRCTSTGFSGAVYNGYSGHATHVAGIVGASAFGVAPGATIRNYAVFADNGYVASGVGLSDVWKTAYNAGARVASMSFNCAGKALCFNSTEIATMGNSAMPMLYVKAAGNNGVALATETTAVSASVAAAAMDRLLVVGSVNASGTISGFSNRAGSGCLVPLGTSGCPANLQWKNHFLVAPGEGIYSTLPNGGLGYMSGTSMAAPVVAGTVALMHARWPALRNAPETVARILLSTATDIGAPGVDDVYGYGLLNVAAAFRANGTVNMVSPTGTTTTVTSKSIRTTSSFVSLSSVLSKVTVYDSFGRDYSIAETGALNVKANLLAQRQQLGRRLLGASRQEDWTDAFFSDQAQPRSFSYYGTSGGSDVAAFALDRSVRMGVDVPFAGGMAQLRLTGAGEARTDIAYDPTLRPLAYFPSTALAEGSLVSNLQFKTAGAGRIMAYGIVTTGAVDPRYSSNPHDLRMTEYGFAPRTTLASGEQTSRKVGLGAGYWSRLDDRTVVGVNASAFSQQGGYYTLVSDLDAFKQTTNMFNLGAAASRRMGSWELMLSSEVTHLRMRSSGGAMAFTPANMVSAEAGVSKKGIAFADSAISDTVHVAVVLPPRAVSGSLRLSYLAPTADGLDRQALNLAVPIGQLGKDPARVETAYQIGSAQGWSLSLSGGVNLERVEGLGAGEALMRFRVAI